jgi:hypothetical protein
MGRYPLLFVKSFSSPSAVFHDPPEMTYDELSGLLGKIINISKNFNSDIYEGFARHLRK